MELLRAPFPNIIGTTAPRIVDLVRSSTQQQLGLGLQDVLHFALLAVLRVLSCDLVTAEFICPEVNYEQRMG